ncbi:hypothetical protein EWM64_g2592 [Hericium alpestre]|uniref:Uncharacterized protein n=1 Tax=Hericium alpestre TaxID=135208 RepID=A0A4Z0A6Z5_9AGAM|nr:hypothetical protein EWM64_g2592 [Hericium alpestre]
MALETGSLYIVLTLRSDRPDDDTFHWALYFHKPTASHPGGLKYHITNLNSDRWLVAHAPESAVQKTFLLVCLVRIAEGIPAERWAEVDWLVRAKDGKLDEEGLTCRVWLSQAIERLRKAGLVRYPSVGELEERIAVLGNSHRVSAIYNKQPRPIEHVVFN